jgi:hypothetical protein
MISSLLSHYAHVQQCSKSKPLVLPIAALVLIAPVKANASPGDDAKAVAALDTQYQAAVKVNDVATMNRILGDDFVLVTGRGAVATKADLLKEARETQTIYERQEEEEARRKYECGATQL